MDSNSSTDSINSTERTWIDRLGRIFRFAPVLVLCSLLAASLLEAQVMGEEAELARLRTKAEEAMANDDPDSAAMNMGRAALLASQLAKKQEGLKRELSKTTEPLLRSQEHTYRAMALFRRAGNQLPASSGVCGSLALAQGSLAQAAKSVEGLPASAPSSRLTEEIAQLKEATDNWHTVTESMTVDYQCR